MQGTGTITDPFKISTPQDLDSMRNNRARNVYYELTNDIDMTGVNWTPIAYYDNSTWISGFEGNFDGKGFRIKNLTINKSTGIYLGLFGQAFYGTIQNVGLENVTINGSQCRFIGALVGYAYNLTVKNCYVSGGNITAQDESGGLLGKIDTCTIENSYSNIPITLYTTYYGGGFVGSVDSNTKVTNSYSNGKVTYSGSSSWDSKSGFAGFIRDGGNVVFTNCFFDKESSGQSGTTGAGSPPNVAVSGVTGKTTSEMKTQSTYSGWDFSNTWSIQGDYPILLAFGVLTAPPVTITIDVTSYMNPIESIINRKARTVRELTSYINTILSDSERHAKVFRDIEGYLSQIDSNATQSHRSVRSSKQDVVSHISPIYSSAYRVSKVVKDLLSTVSRLEGDVSVYTPMNTKAYAFVSFAENVSRASYEENMSNVSHIENPSDSEVI